LNDSNSGEKTKKDGKYGEDHALEGRFSHPLFRGRKGLKAQLTKKAGRER